jgi:hypothetical protein
MEPSGRNHGNRSQIEGPRKRLKQAGSQPVATHGNRFAAHGKEGVDLRPRPTAVRVFGVIARSLPT